MSGVGTALQAHLDGGTTTLARAWAITRCDGVVLGFTDHDRGLVFEGITFAAETGMSAQALSQTTGLSVDNSAAVGAVSSAAITEEDIQAGLYDGAGLRIWLVNWADVDQRAVLFAGSLGELSHRGGRFEVELRGLAEALNQPTGRIFHKRCAAVLGDADCRVDLDAPGLRTEAVAVAVEGQRVFRFAELPGYQPEWFVHGRLEVLSGPAKGQLGMIRADRLEHDARVIELWTELRAPVSPGDALRLTAGCDRRAETCRLKFANFLNFRGFPHIPGEDWLLSYPTDGQTHDGGSLFQ
ncbi:DUF2163 domain-containing protein [Rhodovulum adriaticum]|uniref:Putative phage protein (TIGR02218 family) n=1 Tax=Rhodovulum adriaticum TaxID=35804 RepID=A0A4R2NU19_RHOAD|nr:DUF2163 domain-containing protein [Rhodovulum adriaticum]MBK1636915.1 hypothetical protein [Rhodovulum adriaticum]TCP25470.1 putative phage protein (TIGR02218 family) [Rhodovulum adriaticum]